MLTPSSATRLAQNESAALGVLAAQSDAMQGRSNVDVSQSALTLLTTQEYVLSCLGGRKDEALMRFSSEGLLHAYFPRNRVRFSGALRR